MQTTDGSKSKDAKYIRLAQELRGLVNEGVLKPGDRLPSFVELRSSHQISRGTIEKVHSLLERDGLIVREQGKGVFVAQPSRKKSSGIIGFVGQGFVESHNSMYWAHLMEGAQREAGTHDLQLMLLSENFDHRLLNNLDGLLMGENEDSINRLLEVLPKRLPRVSIMTPIDNVDCVLSDDYQGAFDAARHLLALGHRQIGMLCAGCNRLIETRLRGYQRACRDYGVEPSLSWVRQLRQRPNQPDSVSEFTVQGRNTINEWLRTDWRDSSCTAIIAQNDHAAVGAIGALRDFGLSVPCDISVVGFDGAEMYNFFDPKLTTVAIRLREIGAAAIVRLLELINGTTPETKNIILPADLRIGASSGPVK
jgi:GntR family transcriptional regulator of arabinose operon